MFDFWCGFIAFFCVLFWFVELVACDSTGDEPARWECWAIAISIFIFIVSIVLAIVI